MDMLMWGCWSWVFCYSVDCCLQTAALERKLMSGETPPRRVLGET